MTISAASDRNLTQIGLSNKDLLGEYSGSSHNEGTTLLQSKGSLPSHIEASTVALAFEKRRSSCKVDWQGDRRHGSNLSAPPGVPSNLYELGKEVW